MGFCEVKHIINIKYVIELLTITTNFNQYIVVIDEFELSENSPSGRQKTLTYNELGAFFVEDPLMSIPNPF